MIEGPLLLHVRNHRILRPGAVEQILLGIGWIETALPESFEVNRVCQHQIGAFVYVLRGKKITNVSFRHIADPVVNTNASCIRISLEIGFLQLIAEEVQHTLSYFPLVRYPQSIRRRVLVIRRPVILDEERKVNFAGKFVV